MKQNTFTTFIEWLDNKANTVRALESKANSALHDKQDQTRYKHLMLEKATLLSTLADEAEPKITSLPEEKQTMISDQLGRFSQSAAVAKRIGSVFYMSALLYPEDYKPDQKNDLEAFVDTLRAMAQEK